VKHGTPKDSRTRNNDDDNNNNNNNNNKWDRNAQAILKICQ
jgi:hypothetical protein